MMRFIYGLNSTLIVSGLLLFMLLSMEIGFRIGRRKQAIATDSVKSQSNVVLASMLGLLALFLGFTFSLALNRYDDRSQAVVAEANAIGTAYLRAQLLPKGEQDEVQSLFRRYLDIRIQEASFNLADTAKRESLLQQADFLAAKLWSHAVRASELDERPVHSGLFIQSLNDVLDTYGTRNAALERHVPEIVTLLMFVVFLMTTVTIGHASGLSGHRATPAAFVLVVLIAVVVYLIIDLDRPRRGAIQVSQESMLSLQKSIGIPQGRFGQAVSPPVSKQR
jgi:hypothetical protein